MIPLWWCLDEFNYVYSNEFNSDLITYPQALAEHLNNVRHKVQLTGKA